MDLGTLAEVVAAAIALWAVLDARKQFSLQRKDQLEDFRYHMLDDARAVSAWVVRKGAGSDVVSGIVISNASSGVIRNVYLDVDWAGVNRAPVARNNSNWPSLPCGKWLVEECREAFHWRFPVEMNDGLASQWKLLALPEKKRVTAVHFTDSHNNRWMVALGETTSVTLESAGDERMRPWEGRAF